MAFKAMIHWTTDWQNSLPEQSSEILATISKDASLGKNTLSAQTIAWLGVEVNNIAI